MDYNRLYQPFLLWSAIKKNLSWNKRGKRSRRNYEFKKDWRIRAKGRKKINPPITWPCWCTCAWASPFMLQSISAIDRRPVHVWSAGTLVHVKWFGCVRGRVCVLSFSLINCWLFDNDFPVRKTRLSKHIVHVLESMYLATFLDFC